MARAIELAKLGNGLVGPNPMVGCVVVHDDKIIGEGWHKRYGDHHAEVNAINSVEDKSLLPLSDVYVTLEPCSHHGLTPPCSDLLIRHKVRRVIIGSKDPFHKVNGGGIKKLKESTKLLSIGDRIRTFIEEQTIEDYKSTSVVQ